MDDRVAALDLKARRIGAALAWVAGASVLYLILFIAIMSQLRTPMPSWSGALFGPIPVLIVAMWVLRYWRSAVKGDAAQAQVEATMRSIDDLDDELKRHRD